VDPVRTLVVTCRDWPVVALGHPPHEPVAVVRANRVVATSAAARAVGLTEGLRRREAQRRCPDVVIAERDVDVEARAFERIVVALEDTSARIEITRPGSCLLPTRGPSRYFGGDEALAARVRRAVGEALGDTGGCGVGVADGPFPAALAAECSLDLPDTTQVVVPPGCSPGFVAPMPVSVLAAPGPCSTELTDVLVRLGLLHLADLAALDARSVIDRFGPEGAVAHRLARGFDERLPSLQEPAPELTASMELDPPAERVDQAAFAGKALADGFCEGLASRGLAATRVSVALHTTGGAVVERVWRDGGALTAPAIAQRIRWQLDGWLSRPGAVSRGGVCRIEIRPEDVGAALGRQEGLWGGADARDDRARRAAARLVAMVGPAAVCMPEVAGGRSPSEQVRLVPLDLIDDTGASPGGSAEQPWPGSIPGPQPAVVYRHPLPAQVVDRSDVPVGVNGRGAVSSPPARVSIDGGRWVAVEAWAGPWLVDERWWDPVAHRRRARFQVVDEAGEAHLLALEAGLWWAEGLYD
jgi:protein ImuB